MNLTKATPIIVYYIIITITKIKSTIYLHVVLNRFIDKENIRLMMNH